MLLVKPKLKIVIHYQNEKDIYKRHGDVFIDLPKYHSLVTFEMEPYYLEFLKRQYKYYYIEIQDENLKQYVDKELPVLQSLNEIYEKHHNCDFIRIGLKRKQDHRKEYIEDYQEKAVSNNRGRVVTFTQAVISGIIFGKVDQLIVVDYD